LLIAIVVLFPVTLAAQPRTPNQGYYSGLSTLYPYQPVYCDKDYSDGSCYGVMGSHMSLPKSAPLPPTKDWCEWGDIGDPKGRRLVGDGQAIFTGEGWYQWKPRATAPDKVKYVGERVCFFEDRGEPKNINDFKRP
jgi:hypothetical protein